MNQDNIGWIGLGGMGSGMASNLAHHLQHNGRQLHVYNRTQEKTEEFIKTHPGATAVFNPRDLSATCGITFSSLANDDALKSVFHAFVENRSAEDPPCIFVDTSTVLPTTTHYLATLGKEHNVTYFHCPVFGRPDAAAAGNLLAVLAGGTAPDRELVSSLAHAAFARKGVVVLGSDPSKASVMKLVGNMAIVSQIEVAAECLTMAEKADLPQAQVLDVLGYITGSGIPAGYAKRIAAGDYNSNGGFTVDLGLKDVGHMQTLSTELACPVPVADAARAHLLTAKAHGRGHLDWGAIALSVREAAGLPPNGEI